MADLGDTWSDLWLCFNLEKKKKIICCRITVFDFVFELEAFPAHWEKDICKEITCWCHQKRWSTQNYLASKGKAGMIVLDCWDVVWTIMRHFCTLCTVSGPGRWRRWLWTSENTVDQHQQMKWHPKSSVTVETSHWTSSNKDSVPLHSSSRLWDLSFQMTCKNYFHLKRGLWTTEQQPTSFSP